MSAEVASTPTRSESGPLADLPRVDRRLARIETRLNRGGASDLAAEALAPLTEPLGVNLDFGAVEILGHASGLKRPGVVVQFAWPRLRTRLALGIETPLAHSAVDRLLGFSRLAGQDRLQVTPVEWGLLSYVAARGLANLTDRTGPLGPWDLTLDRVGPEPFLTEKVPGVVTLRWPVRLGETTGSVRLWISEGLVERLLETDPPIRDVDPDLLLAKLGRLTSDWWAEAGQLSLPEGFGSLRPGLVAPLIGSRLHGTAQNPCGRVDLLTRIPGFLYRLITEPAPNSGAGRLLAQPPIRCEPLDEEPAIMNGLDDPNATNVGADGPNPAELPVTLAVELGRISLPLNRLADLRAGDVIELGRTQREPVELTSGGRLVARGELIQIDAELGVRVISVFL